MNTAQLRRQRTRTLQVDARVSELSTDQVLEDHEEEFRHA